MNLKAILNNVLAQSGFLERGGFSTSADPDDKQMIAIANRAAYEMRDYYTWGGLRNSTEIAIHPGQTRYLLPADYQDFIANSAWDADGSRPVEFPVPDGRWFMYKYSSYPAGGTYRIKKYGNEIEIIADAESSGSFMFEYISKWVVLDADGKRKEQFTADSDTFLLDDQLLTLAIQSHWAQTKLMPQYTEWFGNYQRKLTEAIGRDAGGRTIGGISRDGDRMSPYTPLWVS